MGEKRKHIREDVVFPAALSVNGSAFVAFVRNISPGGALLVTEAESGTAVSPGSQFGLVFTAHDPTPRVMRGTIVRIFQLEKGKIGIAVCC